MEEQFGQRHDDRVGIVELFKEMQKINRQLNNYQREHMAEISEVKQVLNNGIVTRTKENTEAIDNLAVEIQDVKDVVNEKENKKQGKLDTWHIVITILSSVGSTIVVVLTILYYLGVIW